VVSNEDITTKHKGSKFFLFAPYYNVVSSCLSGE